MVAERYEVKLDKGHREKLGELADQRGLPASDVIRCLIDEAHEEEVALARRLAAVRRLGEMNVEDVPDPETLSRQLNETYDAGVP